MCCASIRLLIGALFVFAVENEATTMIKSTATATDPVSVVNNSTHLKEIDSFNNFTTPSNAVTQLNTTVANTTLDEESESPTPPPSEHPLTKSFTTDNSLKTVSQSSTKHIMPKPASTTQATQTTKSNGTTFVIIFIIAVLCLSGGVIYCCLQKNSRRYSVDLHPKQEDAQIPLSTVDIEVFDTTSVKDKQIFTADESTNPLTDPAPVKEADKPEEGKETTHVKEENQQNVSSAPASENPKDKMEGLAIVDLNDGELSISTKTSMESLDDVLNENNSNNTRVEIKGNGPDSTEISTDASFNF